MELYKLAVSALAEYKAAREAIKSGGLPLMISGLSSVHKANFIAGLSADISRPMLVITPDELSARRMCDDINAMLSDDAAMLYPSKEYIFRSLETASGEYEQLRLSVLSRLADKTCRIVVCGVDAALQYTIPKGELVNRTFTLKRQQSISVEELTRLLEAAGYVRRPQIDASAQYSVRGGIVDFFPPREEFPIRTEFWGDEVDTIAYFDLDSQRRTEDIESVLIPPASEVVFKSQKELEERLSALANKLKGKKSALKMYNTLLGDIERISSGIKLSTLDKYMGLAYEKRETILDYMEEPVVAVSEYNDCRDKAHGASARHNEDIRALLEEGEISKELLPFYMEPEVFFDRLKDKKLLYFESFSRSMAGAGIKNMVSPNAVQNSGWSGNLSALCEELQPLTGMKYCCVVLAGTSKAASALAKDLSAEGIQADYVKDVKQLVPGKVFVLSGSVSAGFEYPDIKFSLITSYAARVGRVNRTSRRKGEEIKSLSDLNVGDLVVHASHGIGIFDGINRLDLHGVKKDYIKIRYAGADILYVPVTQLDLVSKYIGPNSEGRVKLNKLNSGEWQKTRARVKKAVAEMADELIKLYAARMNTKGYAFSLDDEWQRQFEEHFPYEETEDQLRCAEEIKADMQRPVPMERLLCADVGFGKTEVALRGAFKCVMDSKQCAILCPTTILAWQHYQTILQRMEGFPIRVELLSRFRTQKQQRETIKGLKDGTVDIVVGTHRLVQKDIQFKDLGLAIIDEEQRFGVKHKERFKEMFHGVDILYLSATPIPRTLNMAMSGIRDMSTIEEAPQDRFPVQSYVLEYDINVVADAILREIRRGGQVYYIHNRIESIELCAEKIANAVPEARIGIAHGKMGEEELSEIWKKLLDNEIDVLVCTTIIETGVDVPNCNTIIIEDADNMGLAQLYQLRGRVGRSNRRAYAYFTFRRGKVLTEIAAKRLSAIREFTKFGSGFRIALRDLEIRGAGSLLGAKQHGHMEAVGYDMYIKLLSDAVKEQRGEALPEEMPECLVDISVDAHIPENYIESAQQRLDIYRKIAAVKTYEQSLDITDELIDRFGNPPPSVKGLIDIAMLRNSASEKGIYEIKQIGKEIILKPKTLSMDMIEKLTSAFGDRVSVNAGNKPYVAVTMGKNDKSAIDTIRSIMVALM